MNEHFFVQPTERWSFREERHYLKENIYLFVYFRHSDGKLKITNSKVGGYPDVDEDFATEDWDESAVELEEIGSEDEYIGCEASDEEGNWQQDAVDLVQSFAASDEQPSLGIFLENQGWMYSRSVYIVEAPLTISSE